MLLPERAGQGAGLKTTHVEVYWVCVGLAAFSPADDGAEGREGTVLERKAGSSHFEAGVKR